LDKDVLVFKFFFQPYVSEYEYAYPGVWNNKYTSDYMYSERQLIRPEDLYKPEVMYTPDDYSQDSLYPVYSQDQVQYTYVTPARQHTTKTKKKKRIGKIIPLLLQKTGFSSFLISFSSL